MLHATAKESSALHPYLDHSAGTLISTNTVPCLGPYLSSGDLPDGRGQRGPGPTRTPLTPLGESGGPAGST